MDPREGKEDTRLNFQTQMLLLINLIERLFSFPLLLLPNTLIICFLLEYKTRQVFPPLPSEVEILVDHKSGGELVTKDKKTKMTKKDKKDKKRQ